MNEKTLDFAAHLGFESDVWLDQYQAQFPNLATIVGSFAFHKAGTAIEYSFHSWINKDSFERAGTLINVKNFLIQAANFDSYLQTHQTTFDSLENKTREIIKKQILGDVEINVPLPIDDLELVSIVVQPTGKKLQFDYIYPDGTPYIFFKKGEDYDAIIAENLTLVGSIVLLAKDFTKNTDNFFGLE